MEITMYELLGMIKEGKAPNKIKYNGMIWEYDGDFYSNKNNIILEEYCNLTNSLTDEVEIIEEKKIPEKLDLILDEQFTNDELQAYIYETQVKINQVLDYLKSKGE